MTDICTDLLHYAYDAESRPASVSNVLFTVTYAYTSDAWDAGYTITLTNGMVLSRAVTRDPYRRQLVTGVSNAVVGSVASDYHYTYDMLGRVASRNNDAFGYNPRSEVTSSIIQPSHTNRYDYDGIGNALWASFNAVTNAYIANTLNQYTNIANGSTVEPAYDLDGNLTCDDRFGYAWDAENRLTAVYSNSLCIVSNAYDHMSRRVLKVTPTATHTFVYDGWNLVSEVLSPVSGVPSTNLYVWGKDLSETLQGAGGVGGLLAISRNGSWYFPLYDNNGNVTAYADESDALAAEYAYDAFGQTIAQSGPMADAFPYRFSTKYFDADTGLYYYGYRFYAPELMRWISRDPIGERGGVSLYNIVHNDCVNKIDPTGLKVLFIDAAVEAGSPATIDKSAEIYRFSFALVDRLLTRMDRFTDAMFEDAKQNGKALFNGKPFTGSRSDFVEMLKREKESQYISVQGDGYRGAIAHFAALAQNATQEHDYLVLAAHGLLVGVEPIGKVRFAGEDVNLSQAANAVEKVAHVMGAKGHILFVSCFQTWKEGVNPMDTVEWYEIIPATGHVVLGGTVLEPTEKGWEERKRQCSVEFTPISVKKTVGGNQP